MKTIVIAVFTAVIGICAFFAATMQQKIEQPKVAVFGRTLAPCPPRCGEQWNGVHRRVMRSDDPIL